MPVSRLDTFDTISLELPLLSLGQPPSGKAVIGGEDDSHLRVREPLEMSPARRARSAVPPPATDRRDRLQLDAGSSRHGTHTSRATAQVASNVSKRKAIGTGCSRSWHVPGVAAAHYVRVSSPCLGVHGFETGTRERRSGRHFCQNACAGMANPMFCASL